MRRLNYANVTATLALFFAMSGGAMAAKHYLVNSTKQINPKVLKALEGDKGPPGPKGANGANGANGAAGPTGARGERGEIGQTGFAGSSIVARARTTAPVTTPTEPSAATVPLSGATWTQNAEELNRVIIQVTMTKPPKAVCGRPAGLGGIGTARIQQDGAELFPPFIFPEGNTEAQAAEETITYTQEPSKFLFEPGKATAHTLTAKVFDGCGVEGGGTGGHFKISVAIDVIGVK